MHGSFSASGRDGETSQPGAIVPGISRLRLGFILLLALTMLGCLATGRGAKPTAGAAPTLPVTADTPEVQATRDPKTASGEIGEMIAIPAGPFQMGCDPENNDGLDCNYKSDNGLQLHQVTLDAYQIDKYEVTNASYAQCVAAGGCLPLENVSSATRAAYYGNPEYAAYPVIVDWERANAYCAWAGKRLPTEAEWEKAARGATDTRPYPWGETSPTCDLANFGGSDGCIGDTTAVGSYPAGASPYGALDMVGNVWEWTADWWRSSYYEYSSLVNPLGPVTGVYKVYRGGDWQSIVNPSDGYFHLYDEFSLSVSFRFRIFQTFGEVTLAKHYQTDSIGFRCAAPEEGPAPGSIAIPAEEMQFFPVAIPEPGKANIVGRVVWNQQPMAEAEVMICPSNGYSTFDCADAKITTNTDAEGNFSFENVTAGEYSLQVRLNEDDEWHHFGFSQISPKAYAAGKSSSAIEFPADQTTILGNLIFVKPDLVLTSPPNGAYYQENPTLTWEAYPHAAFYAVYFGNGLPTTGEKVIGTSYTVTGQLQNCEYWWNVEAYDADGNIISMSDGVYERFNMSGQPSSCDVIISNPLNLDTLKEGAPIELAWQPNPAAVRYQLFLMSHNLGNKYYGDELIDAITTPHRFESGLPVGEYTWNVEAFDKDGRSIARSEYSDFNVVPASQTVDEPPKFLPSEVEMVTIPAGPFQMGNKKAEDNNPLHTVTLDAFKIDVYEVTNARYAECVAAGYCQPPFISSDYGTRQYANFPVKSVSWHDANAYCAWRGARLPTEAEWEKAARGGLEGKLYAWGDDKPVCTLGAKNGAVMDKCYFDKNSLAVGSFGPNGYGLYNMSGSVLEWVNDWYDENYYSNSPSSNPQGPESGTLKVLRGGGYYGTFIRSNRVNFLAMLVDARDGKAPDDFSGGFRCAASP